MQKNNRVGSVLAKETICKIYAKYSSLFQKFISKKQKNKAKTETKYMIDSNKKNNLFFLIFFVFLFVSMLITYYRYIIHQDFKYFTTEEEIPNQFDFHTYIN